MDNIDELEALATTIYHVSSVLFSKLFSVVTLYHIRVTPPPIQTPLYDVYTR